MALFQYDTTVLNRFPGVVGGVILARGLSNGPTPQPLLDAFLAEQQATRERLGDTPLSELPSLAAWRRVFSGFGVKPTQYRSAAEALLRRLTRQGDIPSLNALVDLGNLVSIRYALPVAIFDLAERTGAVTVRLARGDERFTPLGESEIEHPEPGEVIFADEAGLVSARRWCWRQSQQSAAHAQTRDALITVEGHHERARDDVRAALDDLMALFGAYQPRAALTAALLTRDAPHFPP